MSVKDHSANPRNEGVLENANGTGSSSASECSDVIKFHIRVEGDVITEASFQCDGCETTVACGSITTELAIPGSWRVGCGVSSLRGDGGRGFVGCDMGLHSPRD